MLSFVSSLEGGEKQSWRAKTVQKHTSYSGTASDESGAFKEKKNKKRCVRHGCGADNLLSFTLLVSHGLKFPHIHEVVVI